MTDSELTMKARGVARSLTYNDDTPQAAAKHMLLELAHRLDTRDVRVCSADGRLAVVNGIGARRLMTLRERLAHRLFGAVPLVKG